MTNDPIQPATDADGNSCNSVQALLLTLFCLFVPVLAFLFWTRQRMPPVASAHGAGIDTMIHYLMVTVGALLLIGHVVLGWFIWRFSRQQRVTFRIATAKVEWKWALVLMFSMALVAEGGVVLIGIPVWKKIYPTQTPSDAVLVEVTAQQFAWNVRYPGKDGLFGRTQARLIDDDNLLGLDSKDEAGRDDVILLGQLCLPVNRTAHVRLRSKDVLHSFFLPQHRVKQDAVPGMVIDVWFVPTQTGQFEILCAELCGLGHYAMRGVLRVLPQSEFDQWLKQTASGGPS